MTDAMMSLQALLAKSADADLLREMIGFADRTLENQEHRASGLNLVIAAIAYWNPPPPNAARWAGASSSRASSLKRSSASARLVRWSISSNSCPAPRTV